MGYSYRMDPENFLDYLTSFDYKRKESIIRRIMSCAYYVILFFCWEYFEEKKKQSLKSFIPYFVNIPRNPESLGMVYALNSIDRKLGRRAKTLFEYRVAADHKFIIPTEIPTRYPKRDNAIVYCTEQEAKDSVKMAKEIILRLKSLR